MNYYNEFDPKAAAWLRELIAMKLIPDGVVDERSIVDVRAGDLVGFRQVHLFCGIGGWPYALKLAGWPEDREVWTGSCPCQSFSVAGKGKGTKDERHLWPEFYRLIRECRPPVIFGEQVCSVLVIGKAGGKGKGDSELVWIDGVRTDLEAACYTVGACDLPAAGVSAPHIRSRLFWVGYSCSTGARRNSGATPCEKAEGNRVGSEDGGCGNDAISPSSACGMAHGFSERSQGRIRGGGE